MTSQRSPPGISKRRKLQSESADSGFALPTPAPSSPAPDLQPSGTAASTPTGLHRPTPRNTDPPSPERTPTRAAPRRSSSGSTPPGQTQQEEGGSRDLGGSASIAGRSVAPRRRGIARARDARGRPPVPEPSNRRVRGAIALIREIGERKHRLRGGELYRWKKLLPREYALLTDYIRTSEDGGLRTALLDELRYDYLGFESKLVIRMPSVCHEGVATRIVTCITDWLADIRNDRLKDGDTPYSNITRETATNTEATGSGQVDFDYRKSSCQPDASFRYGGLRFPGLVIEVAWSQPFADLRRKAERYIKFSQGGVRTVVGISLNDIYKHEYGRTGFGSAMFSVWQSEFNAVTRKVNVRTVNENQVFRVRDGESVPESNLCLSLQDFIPAQEVGQIQGFQNPPMEITSAVLCEMVRRALRDHRAAELRGYGGTRTPSLSPSPSRDEKQPKLLREIKNLLHDKLEIGLSRLRSGRRRGTEP